MEKENKDELDEIFVNKNTPLDKKILASILRPYLTIDQSGLIDYKEEYEELSHWKKILVYLSAKKAMKSKGIVEEELTSPKEISIGAHISESSAKKIAINKEVSKIVRNENGKYFIPNFNLRRCEKILQNEPKEQ